MFKILITALILISAVGSPSGVDWARAGGWIVGSVSILDETGHHVYGEHLAVFLVSRKNPVSANRCDGLTNHQRRVDCINNCHLDFYKRFQRKQQQGGYLIAQTATSSTGNFAFLDTVAGTYYIVVKFPSLIDGYKVAWQEPVTLTSDGVSMVSLGESNLVLPKNRRR